MNRTRPDRHSQHVFLTLEARACMDGIYLGFEGDTTSQFNVFDSFAEVHRARIEAQRAVMQLDGLLKRGRA